jgi:hypothetical protein
LLLLQAAAAQVLPLHAAAAGAALEPQVVSIRQLTVQLSLLLLLHSSVAATWADYIALLGWPPLLRC